MLNLKVKMSCYKYQIRHLPGMQSRIADCLSQAPLWFKSDPNELEILVDLPPGLEGKVTINHIVENMGKVKDMISSQKISYLMERIIRVQCRSRGNSRHWLQRPRIPGDHNTSGEQEALQGDRLLQGAEEDRRRVQSDENLPDSQGKADCEGVGWPLHLHP